MDVGAVIMTTHEIDQISGMAEVFGRACRRVGGKRVDCARSSCKIDTCPCPNEGAFAILSVQLDVARRMVCWRPSLYELEWATSSKIVFFFSLSPHHAPGSGLQTVRIAVNWVWRARAPTCLFQ